MNRTAYIDNQYLARQFSTGDTVRKTDLIDTFALPYVGRVIYSNPSTGHVMVQWPWGAEQSTAVELIKDTSGDVEAPVYFDDYCTYEKAVHISTPIAKRVAARYAACAQKCHSCTCKAIHYGAGKEEALRVFNHLASVLDSKTANAIHRRIFGTDRVALYYKSSPRKYQMSKREEESRYPLCPKCKCTMRPAKVSKVIHVYRCTGPECRFMIHPEDVVRRQTMNQ